MVSQLDGEYGWIVLVIACCLSIMFGTFDYGFSVILGPFAEHFKISTWILSLGGEMIVVIQHFFAPIFAYLGKRFGYRRTLIATCLVAPVSIAASGFAPDAYTFMALFCIVTGFCLGQMQLSSVMILNSYFDKKLVVAHGILTGSQTLGTAAMSVGIDFLAIDYGIVHKHKINFSELLHLSSHQLFAPSK